MSDLAVITTRHSRLDLTKSRHFPGPVCLGFLVRIDAAVLAVTLGAQLALRCVAAAIHGHLFGLHLSELCLPFKSHYFGQDQRRNRSAQLWQKHSARRPSILALIFYCASLGVRAPLDLWNTTAGKTALPVLKTDQPVLSPATLFLIFAFAQGLARVQSGKFVPSLSRLNTKLLFIESI